MSRVHPEEFLDQAHQLLQFCRDPRDATGAVWRVKFLDLDNTGKREDDDILFCQDVEYYEHLAVKVGGRGVAKMECYVFKGVRFEIMGWDRSGKIPSTDPGREYISRGMVVPGPIFRSRASVFSAMMVAPPAWWHNVLTNPTPERVAMVLAGIDPDAGPTPIPAPIIQETTVFVGPAEPAP